MLSWLSAYSSRWVWPCESQRSTANNIHSVFSLSVGFTGRGVRVSCLAFSHTLDVYWVFCFFFCLILLSETLCACSYISLSVVSESLPVRSSASCREQKHHSSVKRTGFVFCFLKSVSKLTNWGTDMSKKAGYPHSVLIWCIKALSRLVCLQKDSHAVDNRNALFVINCHAVPSFTEQFCFPSQFSNIPALSVLPAFLCPLSLSAPAIQQQR